MPTDDWCFLGSIFLEMAPIDIDIEKVKEMFTPAKNAFMHCSNELDNYIQEQYKGALEDEKERKKQIKILFPRLSLSTQKKTRVFVARSKKFLKSSET